VLSRSRSLMAGYLFEYASAAKSPARVSCLVLQLLVRFGVSKQLFALSKMMTDAPTDIDGVFAFKRQNFAKERFYSVIHSQPPVWPPGLERAPGKANADVILADDRRAACRVKGLRCGCEKDVVRFSDHGEIIVIKASPGRLCKLSVIDGGSINGVFSINDCATIDAADETNRLFVLPFGARAGTIVCLDWPMHVGIVLSAAPDGTPIMAVNYS